MPENFRLKFTIEGVPELSRILMMAHKKVTDFSKPLWKTARLVLADVEQQFITEGALSGGWAPLAQSTITGRIKAGYGSGPILQRTGALRRSFGADVTKNRAVMSSRGVPYFKYHQSRRPRTRLPRRPMLVMPDRTRQNIVEEFHKFIRFE